MIAFGAQYTCFPDYPGKPTNYYPFLKFDFAGADESLASIGEKRVNEFGHIADDLTSLEMKVERMLDRAHAKALKAALQRAFVEACKASRAQRLEDEGGTPEAGASNSSSVRKVRKVTSVGSAAQKKRLPAVLRAAQMGA